MAGIARKNAAGHSPASFSKQRNAGGSPQSRKGVWIFSPIQDFTTDELWLILTSARAPWGGRYDEVRMLHKSALGGECPFVVSNDDAPSCGSNSARFGCWTCTVVEKANSLESFITLGHEELIPLADFRKRLKSVSETPEYRSKPAATASPA